MKKLVFLIIIVFTAFSADANTIYQLIKIPNLEIYDLKTKNKLRYLYAKQPFTIGKDNNIKCYPSSDEELSKKYKIIEKNLNLYNEIFLKKINLRYIVLCEDLSISGIKTAGVPDNVMKTLIIDIKFNQKYFERVIHHEVFHIINDSFKELFDQNIWSSYNLKSFKYANCSTCTNKVGLDTYSSTEGFITEYSKSTASEDMAEIFSHLMTNSMPENKDLILEKKIKFIKAKISLISKDSGIFTQ